jgi:hypothetical protein
MVIFDSMNPYESLEFISGSSPEELLISIKRIRTPIKIVAIVPYGNRHVAYIMGDVRKAEKPQKQPKIIKSKGV